MYVRVCVYEREREIVFQWVSQKSYQFLPTFKEYVFIISFTFDYIPFVTEISRRRVKSRRSARKPSVRDVSSLIFVEFPDKLIVRYIAHHTATRHVKWTSFSFRLFTYNSSATTSSALDDVD